jgi:hypothetical protein
VNGSPSGGPQLRPQLVAGAARVARIEVELTVGRVLAARKQEAPPALKTVTVRIALNDSYCGAITLETGNPPMGLQPLEGDLNDVAVPAIQAAQRGHRIGRNDPCWCGPGTKFKKCHGA